MKKQFGFQKGYSTDHAIVLLSDHNFFTIGVFSDLRKTYDTVMKFLKRKLSLYNA